MNSNHIRLKSLPVAAVYDRRLIEMIDAHRAPLQCGTEKPSIQSVAAVYDRRWDQGIFPPALIKRGYNPKSNPK